jgi:hypothetical protein
MLIVGVPGILLSLVVLGLREPRRGQMEEVVVKEEEKKHLFTYFLKEVGATIPPFTLITLYMTSGDNKIALRNFLYGLVLFGTAYFLTRYLGNAMQWYSLAIGYYAFISWMQRLKIVDSPCYTLIFKTKSLIYAILGYSFANFIAVSVGFWTIPYLVRKFSIPASDISGLFGLIISVSGLLGVMMGSLISDRWKRTNIKARVNMLKLSLLAIPLFLLAYSLDNLNHILILLFIGITLSTAGFSSLYALISELTTSRVRATAVACFILLNSMISFASGPFTFGLISSILAKLGYSDADSLQMAILLGLVTVPFLVYYFFHLSSKYIEIEENTVIERDEAAHRAGIKIL